MVLLLDTAHIAESLVADFCLGVKVGSDGLPGRVVCGCVGRWGAGNSVVDALFGW